MKTALPRRVVSNDSHSALDKRASASFLAVLNAFTVMARFSESFPVVHHDNALQRDDSNCNDRSQSPEIPLGKHRLYAQIVSDRRGEAEKKVKRFILERDEHLTDHVASYAQPERQYIRSVDFIVALSIVGDKSLEPHVDNAQPEKQAWQPGFAHDFDR